MFGFVQKERLVPPLSEVGVHFFKMPTLPARVMATQTQIHDAIEMIYMNKGSVTANIDGEITHLESGDFAFFRSRGVHNIYTEDEEENDYYVLKLMPKFLYDISPKEANISFPARFLIYNSELKCVWRKDELEGSEILKNLQKLISEIDSETTLSTVSKIICTLNILEEIYRADKELYESLDATPDAIFDVVSYINVWFEIDLTAEDMAKRANMSYSHFSRSFNKATGKSFRDYLNLVRINHAEQLIINTNLPITEISMKCGYQTVSHFNTMYKRIKGIPPLAARKEKEQQQEEDAKS